jgi:tetratricopeptide (TPR) repeat protein
MNLVKSSPMAGAFRRDLAISYNNLGMTQTRESRLTEAEVSFETAAQLQDVLLAAQPDDAETRSNQGSVWNNLGMLFDQQRRYADGEKAYQQAIANQRRALDLAPTNGHYRALLSGHYVNFARNLGKQAKFDAAVQVAVERKRLWPGNADRLHSVAGQLATTYGQMRATSASQQSQAACMQTAVATLREAVAAGLSRERLNDRSLAHLVGTEHFRKLLEESSVSAASPGATHQSALSHTN